MKTFDGFQRGMGIGGWLTNFKRPHTLPEQWRNVLSPGDFEHFDSYISETDVRRLAAFGMDHVRLAFDQIVLEEKPGVWRRHIFNLLDTFIGWCQAARLNVVLNLHKAIGNNCELKENASLMEDAVLQARFIGLWQAVEQHYQDQPELVFELLNEVRDVAAEPWNYLAGRTSRQFAR